MKPDYVVETINDICYAFKSALATLESVGSFQALVRTSRPLRSDLDSISRIQDSRHLKEPCDGRLTCAFIGSSGHGKTTVLDELFPQLSERGWLVTDVTDTTAQALRISYAPEGSELIERVTVRSWDSQQIKELMSSPDVEEQNRTDGIRVHYREDGVELDGTDAAISKKERAQFRFPDRIALQPFSEPYEVPKSKIRDKAFIRALTIKEQSAVMNTGPILSVSGRPYHALELRAVVQDVCLRDSFQQLQALGRERGEALKKLVFVDTPGLAVNGSIKDEMLRHFLERKSTQIALQLWKNDELDLVIHLVLCGRQSDFAQLWKSVERECGPREMDHLAERLILAVNGMNIYFTNRDIKAKYEDPDVAAREGDHFSTTLEDNVLQKLSPRGRVRPARICFLDSKSIVETLTSGSYEEAYARYRPLMESWAEPGGVGHDTLARLGILESFRENIDALADPEDRGQGFLIRQLLDVVRERGPRLLVKKIVVRTGLLGGLQALQELVGRCYDAAGRLNRESVRTSLKSCLSFLDETDPCSIDAFASESLDAAIDETLAAERSSPSGPAWVARSFRRMCEALEVAIVERADVPNEVTQEFARYFRQMTATWTERWGYLSARLAAPGQGRAKTQELVGQCLRVHGREILFQLLHEDLGSEGEGFQQTEEDREQVLCVLGMLDEAVRQAIDLCATCGVEH